MAGSQERVDPVAGAQARKSLVDDGECGEQVLVVPRVEVERLGAELEPGAGGLLQGFSGREPERYLRLADALGCFRPRSLVEDDPALKQIIPYGLIFHGREVFLMRRSSKGGDARLHQRASLGVGGHVNPIDGESGSRSVENALHRELGEELYVETPFRATPVGVLNDDSNAVGRVHFGVVYAIEVESPRVRVRETERLAGGFVAIDTLAESCEAMETWSRILWDSCAPFAPPVRFALNATAPRRSGPKTLDEDRLRRN